ncbi:hypothetical protein BO71DRAFT_381653 [Aspergillus ellipticus CBS 707.79]|uniref:Uncharacterized protein n=1 Tax=Aspergillus ellipticus CBS 707.79 TaxID=1448320 RepID=A0A319D7W2_9EURO|nr:hypothetical protein BO71DRAFT_381653 [Aspergillus ellipticus CBS 707.79]
MEQDRIELPGFGQLLDVDLPIIEKRDNEFKGQRRRFPHAIRDTCHSGGVSVRERRMLEFIDQITDKPEWDRKVFDENIVNKWQKEACVHREDLKDEYHSAAMFEYCINELRDKATHFHKTGMISVWDSETAIVKSDVAVPPALTETLRRHVGPLEAVPSHQKDWHPGSDQRVLDLLHPSLFPLIHGKSRALPYGTVPLDDCNRLIGAGEIISPELSPHLKERQQSDELPEWGSFQWLPSNIEFAEDGAPRITSYINNLHPRQHKDLYGTLEQFIAAAIPLWNECLSWFEPRLRIIFRGGCEEEDYTVPDGVTLTTRVFDEKDDGTVDSEGRLKTFTLEEARQDEQAAWGEDFQEWWWDNRVFIQTEPEAFRPRHSWEEQEAHRHVDLRTQFSTSGLQVIFKLANILLTPDRPEYEGGTWHIEGAMNEHIVATALYYYDEENITPSHLAFRQSLDAWRMMMSTGQYEYSSSEEFFGIKNDEPAIQNLGSVLTRSGRLLAFPNILQHRVQPFRLEDPTRPGHRKILAMFLVDPYIRVLSTANVPPQRKDWWAEEVCKVPPFDRLPTEIFNMVMRYVEGFPMSWEEAVAARQSLMNERGALVEHINDGMEDEYFNFCEH